MEIGSAKRRIFQLQPREVSLAFSPLWHQLFKPITVYYTNTLTKMLRKRVNSWGIVLRNLENRCRNSGNDNKMHEEDCCSRLWIWRITIRQSFEKGEVRYHLIDKINHHQFPPLFYQVAASQIEPSTVSFPIRKIFQKRRDVRIRLANVLAVNGEDKYIETSVGRFLYDYLVIATGTRTNFYGNEQVENNSLVLKSTYQAINVRNAILSNFEKLLYSENKDGLYNIVIVGGGATGVELSGAFAEMTKEILPKDYPNIDSDKVNVYLLEGSPHTLPNMSSFAQKY